MTQRIDLPNGEYVLLGRARTGGCEVHGWPTEGLARSLVQAMRQTHGQGGIDVCTDCLARAKAEAAARAGLVDAASALNAESLGSPVRVRVALCPDCAAKLRALLHAEGEARMAEQMPKLLCGTYRPPGMPRDAVGVMRRPS